MPWHLSISLTCCSPQPWVCFLYLTPTSIPLGLQCGSIHPPELSHICPITGVLQETCQNSPLDFFKNLFLLLLCTVSFGFLKVIIIIILNEKLKIALHVVFCCCTAWFVMIRHAEEKQQACCLTYQSVRYKSSCYACVMLMCRLRGEQ